MRRGEFHPEWKAPHLLSFVTDASGSYVAIHADLAGVTMLIDELERIREELELNDCPHAHLFSSVCGGDELTTSKLASQQREANSVHEVKIYGWNKEWSQRHGLTTPAP